MAKRAGLRIRSDGIHISPCLPKKWKGLRLTGIKLGKGTYDIAIDDKDVPTVKKTGGVAEVVIFDRTGERLN